MVDLIDRKEILRVIQNFDFHICCARATGKYRTSLEKYEMYRAIREQFLLLIKGIPKVETERHAHWIIEENGLYAKCSNCGTTDYSEEYSIDEKFYNEENKYCCNCGCKMDEEVTK